MSAVSIVSRALWSLPIQGDYELVQQGCAIVRRVLPADGADPLRKHHRRLFHYADLGRTQARLDALGALVLAVVMALVTWRTGVGLVSIYRSGETSTILGIPTWYTYAAMLPGLLLCALVRRSTARRKNGVRARDDGARRSASRCSPR